MYEIELKAWCENRKTTEEKLKSFASFKEHVEKNDEYWSANCNGKTIKLRIREEKILDGKSGQTCTSYLATYKNKEVKKEAGKTAYEVNDEKEFSVDKPDDLRFFLRDAGFKITDLKKKSTDYWSYKIRENKQASIELSEVFNLGTFVEIEILEKTNDAETLMNTKSQLIKILNLCGISEDKIESRYYTDLLKEKSINLKT